MLAFATVMLASLSDIQGQRLARDAWNSSCGGYVKVF